MNSQLSHSKLMNFGILLLSLCLLFPVSSLNAQTDNTYNLAWTDALDDAVSSTLRGIHAGSDLDQDGLLEIICTSYENGGQIHVFEVVGNNSMQWVWSSAFASNEKVATQPRDVKVADMDGNGRAEIIAHIVPPIWTAATKDVSGFYFWEWDGSSDNGFGNNGTPTYILPIQLIDAAITKSDQTEDFFIGDVDKDNIMEIIWPCDAAGTDNDGLYIFSLTNNSLASGSPTWTIEGNWKRSRGDFNGSPKAATIADMDGDGYQEAVFAVWDYGTLSIVESKGTNSYNSPVNLKTKEGLDAIFHDGLVADDWDNNGRDEIYGILYPTGDIVCVMSGADVSTVNSTNVSHLRKNLGTGTFGFTAGDQDQNGLPNLYFCTYNAGGVYDLEFKGGNPADSNNYVLSPVFEDPDKMYHGSFPIVAPEQDLDGDIYKELIVGMLESKNQRWLCVFESASGAFTIGHPPVTLADYGQSIPVKAEFPEGSAVSSVKIYYRNSGSTAYDSIPMVGNDFFQGSIPANSITERGVQYYLLAQNNQGRTATSPSVSPETNPHSIQVQVTNLTCPNSTPAFSYRLFSVPLILDNGKAGAVLIDNLGEYGKEKEWRLFRYQDQQYEEYFGSRLEEFIPGRSFWLITRTEKTIDVGSGLSVVTDSNYLITLQPGWNMIGNPFSFPVNWNQVILSSDIEPPVAYTGDNSSQGYQYQQAQLEPWQGYLVKNPTNEALNIKIPPIEAESGLTKKQVSTTTHEFTEGEWLLQITAECGNYIDRDNYLGCLTTAQDAWDKNDFSEVPQFDHYISLYFPHPEWQKYPGNFTGDFRAPTENGAGWDFSVTTNLVDTNIKLTLTEQLNLPPDWEIILIDKNLEISVNLKKQTQYSFPAGKHNLQLLVGKPAFIEKNDVVSAQIITDFTLFQNFPNPFNPVTQIRYRLPQASQVVLKVYNLAGQEIRILQNEYQQPGIYSTQWDGCFQDGAKVPSGIYWCQVQASGMTQVIKMVLAR